MAETYRKPLVEPIRFPTRLPQTAYLTVSKLLDVSVFCPATGTCETVLTSEYAELFGQPLSLYGMGAYGAVLALSLARAQASRNPEPGPGRLLDQGLVAGVAALATTSAYLMWVLFTEVIAMAAWGRGIAC